MRICSLGRKQVCVVCINGCSYLEKMCGIFPGTKITGRNIEVSVLSGCQRLLFYLE